MIYKGSPEGTRSCIALISSMIPLQVVLKQKKTAAAVVPAQQGWVSSGKNLFLPNLRFKPN